MINIDNKQNNFIIDIAKYFMNFLETDFKKRSTPKRTTNQLSKDGLLVGLNLDKYPNFKDILLKNLNSGFQKEELIIKKGNYTINIPSNLSSLINLRIEEIKQDDLNSFFDELIKNIIENKKIYKEEYDKYEEKSFEKIKNDFLELFITPLINDLEKPLENLDLSNEHTKFELEIEILEFIFVNLETILKDVLLNFFNKETELETILKEVLILETIQQNIKDFFNNFSIRDLFNDIYEIYKNNSLIDKSELYFYFYEISFGNNKFPLFYTNLGVKFENDIVKIELDKKLYLNTKGLDFIVQEYNRLLNSTSTLNGEFDRIFYINQIEDFNNLINSILIKIQNFFSLKGNLDILKSDIQRLINQNIGLSNKIYLFLADKGDESLINDYEEIIAGDNLELLENFSELLESFIKENPKTFIKEIEEEWDNYSIEQKLIYQSPIPLNEEQKQVINALNRSDCKFLILEGPPGTGKSHTITSIICKALLEEKSVLVLSDKKEALDVVEDKITHTLNKIRYNQEDFQNPILRLGKTGNKFGKIIQSQSLSKIKEHARSFRKIKDNFENNKNNVIEDLKSNLIENIEHFKNTSIKDIEFYFLNLEKFKDIDFISGENVEEIEKNVFICKYISELSRNVKNLTIKSFYIDKDLINRISDIYSSLIELENIKENNNYFLEFKNSKLNNLSIDKFNFINNKIAKIISLLEINSELLFYKLLNSNDLFILSEKISNIILKYKEIIDYININYSSDYGIIRLVNKNIDYEKCKNDIDIFINSHFKLKESFLKTQNYINEEYDLLLDILQKIYDFNNFGYDIMLLSNYKLFDYNEIEESIKKLDNIVHAIKSKKSKIFGFLLKKKFLEEKFGEIKNIFYSFGLKNIGNDLEKIENSITIINFIFKLLKTDKYNILNFQYIFEILLGGDYINNTIKNKENKLLDNEKKYNINVFDIYTKIQYIFKDGSEKILLNNNIEYNFNYIKNILSFISNEYVFKNLTFNFSLGDEFALNNKLEKYINIYNEINELFLYKNNNNLEIENLAFDKLNFSYDFIKYRENFYNLLANCNNFNNTLNINKYINLNYLFEKNNNIENIGNIINDIKLLFQNEDNIKKANIFQNNFDGFCKRIDFDIKNNYINNISSKLDNYSNDFINEYFSFKKIEFKILKDFNDLPDDIYGDYILGLEDIITAEMANFIDERLIDYVENNANEVNTLKNIISNQLKFPKDLFLNLKKAFPCIIAGIRDYANYIPLEKDLFDLIVIDEASQVSIAQALPAFIRGKQIVILGDDKQFSNVKSGQAKKEINNEYKSRIKNTFSNDYIAGEDTLGLLTKVDKNFDIKNSVLKFTKFIRNYELQLKKHFRGYPEIISYSNKYFYSNSLQCMKIRGQKIEDTIKFDFIQHDGLIDKSQNINELEANFIIDKLQEFKEKGIKQSVGIISPHREQVSYLFSKVNSLKDRDYFFDDLELKIMTFDTCQGEERDYIFYSMVATDQVDKLQWIFPKSLSYLDDEIEGTLKAQRLNVGFSRAKETIHFVLSKPIEDFKGEIKIALLHFQNELENGKKKIVGGTDINSPMEEKIQHYFYETNFYKNNKDKINFIPQFPIGEYLKQLDKRYNHANYKVDFLLIFDKQKIIIEYDGFKEHFNNLSQVDKYNYEYYMKEDDIYRQKVLEGYGYKFLRINIFNIGKAPIETLDNRLEELTKKKIEKLSIVTDLHNQIDKLHNGDDRTCDNCLNIFSSNFFPYKTKNLCLNCYEKINKKTLHTFRNNLKN